MTPSNTPKPWFDSLAEAAAARGAASRRSRLDEAARHATRPADPTPPRQLAGIGPKPFTRRTGLKMFVGAVAAFLTEDLGLPAASYAGSSSSATCLSDCRNYHYQGYLAELQSCEGQWGWFSLFCDLGALSEYRANADINCPNQCRSPTPPPTTTTTPPPPTTTTTTTTTTPSSGSCVSGYTVCNPSGLPDGVTLCLPPSAICCPATTGSTAMYCSVGELCCPGSDRCALTMELCP